MRGGRGGWQKIFDICQQSLIQNEVQGYHWYKHHGTLHSLVIYYKENIELIMSLSIVSDDLGHDTHFFYKQPNFSVKPLVARSFYQLLLYHGVWKEFQFLSFLFSNNVNLSIWQTFYFYVFIGYPSQKINHV